MLALQIALLLAPTNVSPQAGPPERTARRDAPFVDLDLDAALRRAGRSDKVVFIDFFTTWCGPCKRLDVTTWKDARVRTWLERHTVALKVDADEEKQLAERYRVRIFPTLLFLAPDGSELERIVGYVNAREFRTRASAALSSDRALERARDEFEARPDDPSVRQSYARALGRAEKYEQALEHFLWCFDHGLEHSEGYGAVRSSYLLNDIIELGREYAPAIEQLQTRRDRARQQVQKATAPYRVVADYVALNRALGNASDSVALLDSLKRSGHAASRAARLIADMSADLLLDQRRYTDLHEIAGHDLERIEKRLARFDATRRITDDDELLRTLHSSVVRDACACFEVLVGVGRAKDAVRAIELVAKFDPTRATFERLLDHALHAESFDAAQAVVEAARQLLTGSASEQLAERLEAERAKKH